MKIVAFTTKTLHHTWFLERLAQVFPNLHCIIETSSVQAQFDVAHAYEELRDDFESDFFFNRAVPEIKDICKTSVVRNINDPETLQLLEQSKPDVIVDFGTRKISADIVNKYAGRIINLHGGDPELYRGLDSHLWAIYHRDYPAIITTLHLLTENLDEGNIIQKKQLELIKAPELHQLRAINTQVCVELTTDALTTYDKLGQFQAYQQKQRGRYYSFMPASLKEICLKRYNRYVGQL